MGLGSNIKKNVCLLYPYLPTITPLPKTFTDTSGKVCLFFFLAPFSSENHDFPIMQQCKQKKPTYLPNQKVQGRDTANKHFFLRMAWVGWGRLPW